MFEYDEHCKFMDYEKQEYIGQYSYYKNAGNIHPLVKKAHTAHQNIKLRTGGRGFHTYKNVKCDVPVKKFIFWYIVQTRFFKLKRPTIGRIDHKKGYVFENLFLQEHSDNSKEVHSRFQHPLSKAMPVKISKNGVEIAEARSLTEAAKLFKLGKSTALRMVQQNRKSKKSKGYMFSYGN